MRTACFYPAKQRLAMASNASVAIPVDSEDESSYYDILLVGKTGTGKSTTANKLLGVDPATNSLIGRVENVRDVIKQWGRAVDENLRYFIAGGGTDSVTQNCTVFSNETSMNRILDTPGFADTSTTQRYGVLRSNLQIFRWILRAQRAHNLRFSRVLYFLPSRGPLERADGALQEEIKVMYDYFGKDVFDIMVIVATNNKKEKFQKNGFDEDDITQTKKTFMRAFEAITGERLPSCPPVVYLSFTEEDVERKIVSARVIAEEKLHFSPEYPKARTHGREGEEPPIELDPNLTQENIKTFVRKNRGKKIHFQDRCTRCAVKIVQEVLPSGEEISLQVIFENGDREEYDNSYCHPVFIPKYSRLAKFVGGIAHIVTVGSVWVIGKVIGKKAWPGFTNSDEVCPVCGRSPGSDGCSPVGQLAETDTGPIETNHSKTLDRIIEVNN